MKGRKIIFLSLLAIAIVVLGFFREHVFVGINRDNISAIGSSYSGLSKWILTFVFIIIFLLATFLFLYLLFESRRYALLSVYVYLFLLGVSAIVSLAGMAFSSFENVYPFVRALAGIMQSPLVLVILIPFCLIADKLR